MTLNWIAPTTGGAVESYTLYDTVHAITKEALSTDLSTTWTDLNADTDYNLFIKAKNAIGESDGSSMIKVRTDKTGGEASGPQVTAP